MSGPADTWRPELLRWLAEAAMGRRALTATEREVAVRWAHAIAHPRTESGVRMALCRGLENITIPPSFSLGKRRVWLKTEAIDWLHKKAKANAVIKLRERGRPMKGATT